MKFLFTVALLFASLGLHAQDSLSWCPERKLVWKDFQFVKTDSPFTATTTSVVKFGKGKDGKIDVLTMFIKSSSWAKDTLATYVLQHEQVHFDIAEWTARRIRQYLSQQQITSANRKQVYSTMGAMVDFEFATDAQYDAETGHGQNVAEQERWEKKVKDGLAALAAFRAPCKPDGK